MAQILKLRMGDLNHLLLRVREYVRDNNGEISFDEIEALIATERIYPTEVTMSDFINTSELADLMNCSVAQARAIMHRKDFPMVRIGREMKVQRRALAEWASTRRE